MDSILAILKPVLVFAAVLFFIFFLPLYLLAKVTAKRTKEMKGLANKLGARFTDKGKGNLLKEFSALSLFKRANPNYSRECNLIQSQDNQGQTSILDLSIRTSIHDKSANIPTVVCFKSSQLNFPEFYLKPRQMLDTLSGKLGYRDVKLDKYPDFFKTYFFHTKDRSAINALLTKPEVVNFLKKEKNICIEGKGEYLIVYTRKRGIPYTIAIDKLEDFIKKSQQIFFLFAD